MGQAKPTPTGGFAGALRRFWYYLIFFFVGIKWNIIELFTRHRKVNLTKTPRRPKDVVIITGGARGIGAEVVKKLLILEMHVVIGCRDPQAGIDTVRNIRDEGIKTGNSDCFPLDLTSLDSVRKFANIILQKYPKIHILINNAGIMIVPYNVTKDELESQFHVNYLSHFLLTNLLLPRIVSTGTGIKHSRIVNVSSVAHYGGHINFNDLQMEKMYSAHMAYMSSKLMQVVFTKDLEQRLKSESANVHVYAVHPGVVKTDLHDGVGFVKYCGCCARMVFKNPEQGADCILYAAVSNKLNNLGGNFFANCKKESPNKLVKDVKVQKQLWDVSCSLTGLSNGKIQVRTPVPQITVSHENEIATSSSSRESTPSTVRPGNMDQDDIAGPIDDGNISNSSQDSDSSNHEMPKIPRKPKTSVSSLESNVSVVSALSDTQSFQSILPDKEIFHDLPSDAPQIPHIEVTFHDLPEVATTSASHSTHFYQESSSTQSTSHESSSSYTDTSTSASSTYESTSTSESASYDNSSNYD